MPQHATPGTTAQLDLNDYIECERKHLNPSILIL